ncbi:MULTISPECIES: FtsW/RodA/SpoVE family cell cycle protein [Cytobacillus]|uniref:FtsW/RodA/SpoVE family cell cycle protein n=1 Tax=Cytobacillus TaxID=2675230 RepID=UPI001CD5AC62|nr:FtsW/RodA/SpoVE family cell cycle protein [Cytobacillus kochii]MCA1027952.1 rod shape-determining protein RodA [Cytobacillus kochii]MCM3323863.1 rod shape-determining protein RodA [Cytobacillus kochii]MCM3346260.1 rod shape-determining protein RodA [Cytobacillus kochii]MDM5205882.1 FtsW/RodA/SpoVE family cell cycle protein [Cytobacillus kochii]
MDRIQKKNDRFDWTLALILFLFCIISCTAIYSGQTTAQYPDNFVLQQIIFYSIGMIVIAAIMYFDSDQIKRMTWILFGIGTILQAGLFIAPESLAYEVKGAKLWYNGLPGPSLQPSEFFKIFLILALSKVIVDHYAKYTMKTVKNDLILFIKLGLVTCVPLGLIILEDLGTALVIIAIFTGILLVSGITWKIILPVYGTVAAVGGTIIYYIIWAPETLLKYLSVDNYQLMRIYAWLDPYTHKQGAGLQLYNSLHAIGSGELGGKGFYERQVYIPDVHTDFIFSVIGEEYGFIGASVVICLYFILIFHLTKIALSVNDPFNTYVCVGVISYITFHVFQNIGMTIQVLPITGIPLPFISYGGSSLIGNMMAMGLIFSIRFHQKSYMFQDSSKYYRAS